MASTSHLLRISPLSNHHHNIHTNPRLPTPPPSLSFPFPFSFSSLDSRSPNPRLELAFAGGNGSSGIGRTGGGGGGGRGDSGGWSGGDGEDESSSRSSSSAIEGLGPLGHFLNGWRSRVAADPQFPFKVLMEELVGVSACVLGDMASRPNFGLNELDFVFSTLVVGSILNFVLMYLLAPTISSSPSNLPAIFANFPKSHMFEAGSFTLGQRLGTLLYKGTVFAAVGLAAGLVGTAISNGLMAVRKKMDPEFETPNKPPPTLLNAVTWAIHMGVSSNLRYQTLNGIEFVLAKGLSPLAFKSSVVVLRCLNNVLGGMSFVVLARLTGSQSVEGAKKTTAAVAAAEKEKLVEESKEALQSSIQSTYK